VYNGRFALQIGADKPYQHVADMSLFLEIWIKGPQDQDFVKLGGRQQFLSAPYAIAASRADTDFSVPGQLGVTGNTTLQNNLAVSQDTTINRDLYVQRNASIAGILHGRVLGGAQVFCTGNSAALKGCSSFGTATCPSGPSCGGPSCSKGKVIGIANGRCYWNDVDDYCYHYLCLDGF
jgi:hypothetical protein